MANQQHILKMDTNQRQQRYVDEQRSKGGGSGIVFADAFIRGMRDIGYKDPAWALAEEIDNSIQASASVVEVRFGFDAKNGSKKKPDYLAVVDNGAGMIPEMISYAVRWGGTDRENSREGFGRYGYGLPSSIVSMACRYTVYSKVPEGTWNAVTVDLNGLAEFANNTEEVERALKPRKSQIPDWLLEGGEINLGEAASGTVIVLEDLDRLRTLNGWITLNALKPKLLSHFGVIYRHWIPDVKIVVDSESVSPVDPLFQMEHAWLFEETSVRPKVVKRRTIEIENKTGGKGKVTIRASILPPNFQWRDPNTKPRKGEKMNARFNIMKRYNGILVCREGRQIDCVQPPWTKFQNYDVNIKVEIDFDPSLDEFFGISTSKQQIVIDDDMWEKLQQSGAQSGGLNQLVKDMRSAFGEMQDELKATGEEVDSPEQRPSEDAMAQTAKFKTQRTQPSPEKVAKRKRSIEEAAKERAEASGRTPEEEAKNLENETAEKPYKVEFKAVDEGPFYLPKSLGDQKRLIINTAHPFYRKVYNQALKVRSSLEVLLFAIADAELDAEGEKEAFYKAERNAWSERLRQALDIVVTDQEVEDDASMQDEKSSDDEAA